MEKFHFFVVPELRVSVLVKFWSQFVVCKMHFYVASNSTFNCYVEIGRRSNQSVVGCDSIYWQRFHYFYRVAFQTGKTWCADVEEVLFASSQGIGDIIAYCDLSCSDSSQNAWALGALGWDCNF